ncbi:DUF4153 domain-containing protein [Qipengyuania profunda]|jgi:hypothetical protein|uniref:DUF4153 domain-containing protein n=1 Tax=Qipengyuania profunda TaxID=3113984 RepID=UPI002A18BAD2|nr:DUF4153 domain-containing protein [Qipengyuania sp. HL-TH1]WPL56601.1 DUF4153 domain-containing protein [Qipengyuania sp. HL-TH5]
MSEMTQAHAPATHADWPLRPWLLAALLGIAGLCVHLFSDWNADNMPPWRAALVAAFAFGPLALAFTVDRLRWKEPLVFAGLVALVMAGIAWRVTVAGDRHADESFWLAAGLVAITLAMPLFQAGFHRLRWRTAYDQTHFHVWTDAISGAGALVFTGVSWLLVVLLAALFSAIDIDIVENVVDEPWFGWTFSGAAFGAALGVLRNQLKIIGTLQSVVMLVFSIIAVPLAAALAIFLLAVLASGIAALWNATESPTPLLLSVAVAAFVLVNAVIRNADDEVSGNRALRWASLVLALAILPLALLAAVSAGTRIAEYGLSPERLWGIVAVAVAVAYGVAYFAAPIRGRIAGWMERVRRANMHLAVATCVLAFILALPLFDFGAISARNQIARLDAGEVAVDEFDFDALRWDFGDAGREALARLTDSNDPEIAKIARETQTQDSRPYRGYRDTNRDERLANIRFEFEDEALRDHVRGSVRGNGSYCDKPCVALDLGAGEDGRRKVAMVEGGDVRKLSFDLGEAVDDSPTGAVAMEAVLAVEAFEATPDQTANSEVEIREWSGRRVYIDGQPAGDPFE